MAEERGASSGREGPSCPTCGKGVDPLRAGEVAIFDGRFVYFCDRDHKARYLRQRSGPASDEVVTAAPPQVEERRAEQARVEEETARARAVEDAPPSVPSRREEEPDPRTAAEAPEPAAAAAEDEPPPSELTVPAPRSVGPASVEAPAPPGSPIGVAYAGVVAGVLAASVALLGPQTDPLRLPLAALACAVLAYVLLLGDRGRAERRGAVHAGPVLASLGVALWARLVGEARAPSLAAFAGVAAACGLGSELLHLRARAVTEDALRRLGRSLDVPARVVRGDETASVVAGEVRAGEQVVVEEGEVVPVDGIVAAGESVVVPWIDADLEVSKREGDAVVSGARVVRGRLRLTATWTGVDRAFLRLLPPRRMAAHAPVVRAARLATVSGAPLVALAAVAAGLSSGAAALEIAAAACAAAVAVGSAAASSAVHDHVTRGLLRALRHGVLYRDAEAFDRAGQTDVAVACARGTVLLGEPEIVSVEAMGPLSSERVLELASGAATGSSHPFAAAILRAARMRGVRPDDVRNAIHVGSGATAIASGGERLVLGRRSFLLGERVSVAVADARVGELEAQGRSVLLLAVDERVCGLVALQDGIRAGARAAVQRLLDARIEPVLMSGEARETCETIGRALDIEHLRPELGLQERGPEVRALSAGGHVVAVLGHPSLDDSALAAADVAVALGAAGAAGGDWALTLASDDVRDAATGLVLARRTRERARVAMVVGLLPAALGGLVVALGLAPLVVAPLSGLLGSTAAFLYAKE
jgi:cation transport ATPase